MSWVKECLNAVAACEKKAITFKINTVSEKILSVFSRCENVFGFIFMDPINMVEHIVTLNALGCIVPSFSYISLTELLNTGACTQIKVIELSKKEYNMVHQRVITCEILTPEKWVRFFIQKQWTPKYKEKNPYLFCMNLISTVVPKYSFSPHCIIKQLKENKEDKIFLSEVWPYIVDLLFTHEYRFASLVQISSDNVIHQLSNSMHTNVLMYNDLKKYKSVLPPLEKNKLITIQVEPCENINDICEEFRRLYYNVINQVQQKKPVEISWNDWLVCVNKLFKSAGKAPIAFDCKQNNINTNINLNADVNINANLIEPKSEKTITLSNEKSYRIYNHLAEFPVDMKKEDKEELLLLLNAISTPEHPYQHVQTALINSICSHTYTH